VERVALEATNFLAGRGHDVHLFSSDADEAALLPEVTRHHVASRRHPSLWGLATFARKGAKQVAVMAAPADVTVSFGVQSPPGSVTWVQSVQAAWLEVSRRHRGWRGRLKQRLNPFHAVVLWLERRYYGGRRYRKLVALTEDVKADLMRLYGVPAEDVVVIPNGYAPREFNVGRVAADREAVRRELGYGSRDRVVVFVANELERKGFGPLVRAVAHLGDPSVQVLVVGRVSPAAYAAELERLGLGGRVRFVGPSNDVARYYAAADVFSLPTQYEAWGLVIVEALACGLPVLTSRNAGAAVAVEEGRNGLLLKNPDDPVEIAEGLRRLLDGGHEPREVVAASAAPYAWGQVLPRLESLLRELSSQSAGRVSPVGASA
jgi:UDP-glucose:(heptosyl)LPS alpha-1,3-glucosyltransferase